MRRASGSRWVSKVGGAEQLQGHGRAFLGFGLLIQEQWEPAVSKEEGWGRHGIINSAFWKGYYGCSVENRTEKSQRVEDGRRLDKGRQQLGLRCQ